MAAKSAAGVTAVLIEAARQLAGGGAAATVMLQLAVTAVSFGLEESTTLPVKVKVPVWVGVPPMSAGVCIQRQTHR